MKFSGFPGASYTAAFDLRAHLASEFTPDVCAGAPAKQPASLAARKRRSTAAWTAKGVKDLRGTSTSKPASPQMHVKGRLGDLGSRLEVLARSAITARFFLGSKASW